MINNLCKAMAHPCAFPKGKCCFRHVSMRVLFSSIGKTLASYRYSLAFIIAFMVMNNANAQAVSEREPRILYINSYHPGNAWSDMIFSGIRETLTKQYGKQCDLRVEYLDAKRYGTSLAGKLGEQIALSWQEKYKDVPIDVILVSDQDGYSFVNRLRDKLFPGVPLVFSGVENPGEIAPNTTGVLSSTDFAENMALIHQTLPGLKELWVVTDPSTTGTINRKYFDEAAKSYKNKFNIRYFDEIKRGIMPDQLIQKASSLEEGSAIFFLDYYRTPNNDAVNTPEFLQKLCSATVPVFSHVDAFIDYGVTGGYMNSGELQGRQIAQLAAKIIGGSDISTLKPEIEHALAIFDDEKLIKFGITAQNLPKNSFFKTKDQINPVKYSRISPGMGGNTIYARGDQNYPPFEFTNAEGKPDGFNVEIIKAVAKAMGMEVQLELGVWNEVCQQLEAGGIDLLIGMYNSPEHDEKIEFSIPIFMASYAVYVREGSHIKRTDDLKDKTVLMHKGDIAHDYVIKNNITQKIIQKKEWSDVLLSLSKGEGDAAVIARIQGNDFIIREKIGNIKTVGPPIIQRKYCIAVSEGNSLLLSRINEGLSLIKTSGEYDRIYEKWFGVVNTEADAALITRKILLWVALPLVILLLIFLVFSWILKRQVNRKTRELNESEKRFRFLFEAMPFPVTVSKMSDQKLIYINDAYSRKVGRQRSETIGRSSIEMGADPEISNRQRAELLENGKLDGVIIEMPKPEGSTQWFQYSAIMTELDGEQVAISGLVDITALKQAEKTLLDNEDRLQKQNNALLSLMSRGTLFQPDLQKAIAEITEVSSDLINTKRASVWLYNDDCSEITCLDLYQKSCQGHTSGETLRCADFPSYTNSHKEGQVIAATDVYTDPRTADIPASYYEEHGIFSLLDVPIYMRGRLTALLSFEQTGENRAWNSEDVRLATIMASLLSICFTENERKQAQSALANSEARLREIGNNLPNGMIYQIVQPEEGARYFTYVSAGAKTLHGVEPEQILKDATLVYQQFHPEDIERFDASENVTLQNRSVFDQEARVVLPSGDVSWRRFISSPRLMVNGDIVVDGIEIDITDRKNDEQALINYKNNLELMVKERTEELQTTNEELISTNEELFCKNDIIERKNEELKQTLEHLKQTQLKLIEAEKMASLGTLTAGVAHEINNPLNFIMGSYVGMKNYFKRHGSHDENQTQKLLDAIKLGIDRTSDIVNGLNQFSRDSSGYAEECNIAIIMDNCLTIVHNKTKHRIDIEKDYGTNAPVVDGNAGKLHQVFLNVLTNAIDAIADDGLISIAIVLSQQDVRITIADTGEGIDQKHITQIFDPFYTTKPPGKGTGLGLSITYSIIKDHHGTIEFESEKNKGTKVTITLPIKHTENGKERYDTLRGR